jgi:excisionase family DNA binding protein
VNRVDALALEGLKLLVREVVREALQEAQGASQPAEGYILTAEAARRAGVGADAVLGWISKGLLPATKPQGAKSWRIRPADLDRFLESTGPQPAPPLDLDEQRRVRAARLAGRGTR